MVGVCQNPARHATEEDGGFGAMGDSYWLSCAYVEPFVVGFCLDPARSKSDECGGLENLFGELFGGFVLAKFYIR